MRFLVYLLIFFSWCSSNVSAQDVLASPHASIGIQYASDGDGNFLRSPFSGWRGIGEVYVKDNISIWGSAQLTYSDLRLGFGGDTVNTVFLPYGVSKENTDYINSRQVFSFRAGVRFYKRAMKPQIAVWASPVFGYSHDNLGSKSYKEDLQREDLSFNYTYLRKAILARKSIRRLELGAEVGARWSFTRHFYVEGSVMFTVDRKVKVQYYSTEGGFILAAGFQF